MIAILFTLLSLSCTKIDMVEGDKDRLILYKGTEIKTTFDVPVEFIGLYEGRKAGYLKLNPDGTGEYKYDIFGMAPPTCERTAIKLNWGFVLDKKGKIIKNKRDYGYSYPILLESTGSNSFQGCRTPVMKDFILKRGNSFHISSSDDWQKAIN